jgi:hypothetical protein
LSSKLQRDPRFALVNQDVEDGYVKFRTEERLRLLNQLLLWHNHGVLPASTLKTHAISKAKMKKLGFDFAEFVQSLENVTGPNEQGYMRARCPTCEDGDEKMHGLSFNLEGAIHCFRGCSYMKIIGKENKEVTE